MSNNYISQRIIYFTIAVLGLLSCKVSERLENIYGMELSGPWYHMMGSARITIFKDSTFKYSTPGFPRRFSSGTWQLNKNSQSIILNSIDTLCYVNWLHYSSDSVCIEMDGTVVKLKTKKRVKIGDTVFGILE